MQILSIRPRSCLLGGSLYGRLAIGRSVPEPMIWVCGGVGKCVRGGQGSPCEFAGEHFVGHGGCIRYLLASAEPASARVVPPRVHVAPPRARVVPPHAHVAPSRVADADLQTGLWQLVGPWLRFLVALGLVGCVVLGSEGLG